MYSNFKAYSEQIYVDVALVSQPIRFLPYVLFSTSGNTSASNNTSNTGPGGGQLTLPQLQQMMQLLSGSGVPASGGERQNTDQTPEERAAARYSVQLSRLEGMGFVERAANIRG